MLINYRELSGIQQRHLGHSGGAGARGNSQPLMLCRQRGCEILTFLPKMIKGASTLLTLSLLETLTVSGKIAAAAEVGCPKCTGSIEKSLAKATPCAFHLRCLFLWGLTARLRQREWLWMSECCCRVLAVLSSIHWGVDDLCLTHRGSVLLWDCPNTVYSLFFMSINKIQYSLPKTNKLHKYSDVPNHDFPHTAQNNNMHSFYNTH